MRGDPQIAPHEHKTALGFILPYGWLPDTSLMYRIPGMAAPLL